MQVPRGLSEAHGYDKIAKLGKCACGARVCLVCHDMAVKKTVGNETIYEHTCPENLHREDPTDALTVELMQGLCKQWYVACTAKSLHRMYPEKDREREERRVCACVRMYV